MLNIYLNFSDKLGLSFHKAGNSIIKKDSEKRRSLLQEQLPSIYKKQIDDLKKAREEFKRLTLDIEEELVEGEEITETPEQEQARVEAQDAINESEMFKSMTGKEMQSMQRVVRKYNKGEINKSQAQQMLSGFGLNDKQMEVWLSDE